MEQFAGKARACLAGSKQLAKHANWLYIFYINYKKLCHKLSAAPFFVNSRFFLSATVPFLQCGITA
jgi:hypothetical protein